MKVENNLQIIIALCLFCLMLFVIIKQRTDIVELDASNQRLFIIKDMQFELIHSMDSILIERDSLLKKLATQNK